MLSTLLTHTHTHTKQREHKETLGGKGCIYYLNYSKIINYLSGRYTDIQTHQTVYIK